MSNAAVDRLRPDTCRAVEINGSILSGWKVRIRYVPMKEKMVDFCCIAVAAELWYVCVQRQFHNLYMEASKRPLSRGHGRDMHRKLTCRVPTTVLIFNRNSMVLRLWRSDFSRSMIVWMLRGALCCRRLTTGSHSREGRSRL